MTSMSVSSKTSMAESITGLTNTFSDPKRGVRTVSPLRGSGTLLDFTQRFRAGLFSTARFAGWSDVARSTSSLQTERSRTCLRLRRFKAISEASAICRTLVCGVILLALVAGAAAQTAPPKKKPRSARAVALIEWKKDAKGALTPRLVPISFLWEGKYYDAGLYEAAPLPLALETGTVYEAVRSGVPAGLFTVRGGTVVGNVWYGVGQWNPGATIAAAKSPGDDGRPRLKRAAGASEAPPEPVASPGVPPANAPPKPEPNDPNRPRLHRGPATRTGESPVPTPASKAARTGESPVPTKSSEKPEPLVAVSDAESHESLPYLFPWTRDEEERLTGEMKALAEAEVARQGGGAKVALEQVQIRAFDLYTDNLPEIVLSARTAAGKQAPKGLLGQPRIYYVTLVARVTVSGELRKLFASVTSSSWLGSVPRMEVVDAVDADGDGKGDLLFTEITESSHSYVLYRVGRDELFQLVETGPIPND